MNGAAGVQGRSAAVVDTGATAAPPLGADAGGLHADRARTAANRANFFMSAFGEVASRRLPAWPHRVHWAIEQVGTQHTFASAFARKRRAPIDARRCGSFLLVAVVL